MGPKLIRITGIRAAYGIVQITLDDICCKHGDTILTDNGITCTAWNKTEARRRTLLHLIAHVGHCKSEKIEQRIQYLERLVSIP